MSTPFGLLIAQRANDPQRCCEKAVQILNRYGGVSSNQRMSLDEAAWLGAICFLGLNDAAKQQMTKTKEGNVINVIAGSGVEATSNAS